MNLHVRKRPQCRARTLSALALALTVAAGAACEAHAGLAEAELAGYRLWLHSLEQTASARMRSGGAEQVPLFPFDRTEPAAQSQASTRTRASVGRAAAELERAAESRATAPARAAFVALARARIRVNFCRFDSALVWYRTAAELDTAGNLRGEIVRESLATALAAGDTAAAGRALSSLLSEDELAGQESAVVLAYRFLLARADSTAVDRLIARVADDPGLADGRLLYWQAQALAWRGRAAESLDVLGRLLGAGGLSHGLSEAERTWVLTAVPDLLVLEGDEDSAGVLYRMLAASVLPAARIWGGYRQAGLDLASGRYAAARDGYAQVCAEPGDGPWRQRACALEGVARRLAAVREEGEAYGIAYDAR